MAKEIVKRDERGSRLQCFERYEVGSDIEQIEGNDLDALLEMSIQSLDRTRKGFTPKYTEDEAGFQRFAQGTIEYLEYVKNVNGKDDENGKPRIIPDIEGWATFLGLTRKTIFVYEKQRSEQWTDFIGQAKNAIAGLKKQLTAKNKVPVVYSLFDLCNNHGYSNTSEFKVETIPEKDTRSVVPPPPLTDEELQELLSMWDSDSSESNDDEVKTEEV